MRYWFLIIISVFMFSCGSDEKEPPADDSTDTSIAGDRETGNNGQDEYEEPEIDVIKADLNHIIGAEKEELYSSCSYPGSKLAASSTKGPGSKQDYEILNIGDNDIETAWVEGSLEYGIGEYFEFEYVFNDTLRACENYCQYFTILNGYQRSPSYFRDYSRVKRFKVYINGKLKYYLDLHDEPGMQFFYMDFLKGLGRSGTAVVRFEIAEIYPGTKRSKKETAVTELFFSCEP